MSPPEAPTGRGGRPEKGQRPRLGSKSAIRPGTSLPTVVGLTSVSRATVSLPAGVAVQAKSPKDRRDAGPSVAGNTFFAGHIHQPSSLRRTRTRAGGTGRVRASEDVVIHPVGPTPTPLVWRLPAHVLHNAAGVGAGVVQQEVSANGVG